MPENIHDQREYTLSNAWESAKMHVDEITAEINKIRAEHSPEEAQKVIEKKGLLSQLQRAVSEESLSKLNHQDFQKEGEE